MVYGIRALFDPIRELSFGSIAVDYTQIGTDLSNPARLVSISNSTNVEVYISLDGTTNHIRMAPTSFILFDFTSNKVRDDGLFISEGTGFYVKRVSGAPASGAVWVEIVYANGGF